MDYVEAAAARSLPGLRLALTVGVPAPYSMSARAVFDLRGVPYTPVAQYGGAANPDLVAWTRHRNAPVAVYEEEAPRTGWLEILNLAERLGGGPSLLPEDVGQRMTLVGLTNELIGENGFIWQMRLIMLGLGGPERAAREAERNPMYADYGYSEAAVSGALERARVVLELFTDHARRQRAAGSRYLIGERLTALDIYWAYFSQLVSTLPEADCPMPAFLRTAYDLSGQALGGCDPVLLEQRQWIFEHHLPLPMDF
jgi:glutathione S-transferase